MNNSIAYLILFFICFSTLAKAQQNDSLSIETRKDSIQKKRAVNKAIYSKARKATIMSACLPGLGQIYNRKYWKAPVIYVALGGLGYWGLSNQKKYKYYSDNLRYANDDDINTTNVTLYSNDQLIAQKRYYRKFRDMSIMLGALVYVINIIDANVDAHLIQFNVNENLSLRPEININDITSKQNLGLVLNYKF